MLRPFDVIFLDFYGTVTSGDRHAVEAAARGVVEGLGVPMSVEDFAVAWGNVFFEMCDACNGDRFRTLYEIERDSLAVTLDRMGIAGVDPAPFVASMRAYWGKPSVHPEAIEALAGIDVPICLVSNADTADVLSAIETHGLQFDHVVTSEDARSYKPHGGIFEAALRAMDVSADRVLHAGDSLHSDVSGAASLGIQTAWICREGRIYDIGECKPDHKLSCLGGLRDLVCSRIDAGL